MSKSVFSLSGKKLLCIGAYSGIGSDFCRFASQDGAEIFLVGRRSEPLQALEKDLATSALGTLNAGVESIDQFKTILKDIAKSYGPFDGVFHCAGRENLNSVRALSDKEFQSVFSGSFMGAAALAAVAAGKKLIEPGGSVVLMSSVVSERPQTGMAQYSASKAAVDALIRSAASELSRLEIRINSIAAGAVETAMQEKLLRTMPEAARANFESAHPLGFGSPRDVSLAAAYLLSDASKWSTGTTLVIDGGFLAG